MNRTLFIFILSLLLSGSSYGQSRKLNPYYDTFTGEDSLLTATPKIKSISKFKTDTAAHMNKKLLRCLLFNNNGLLVLDSSLEGNTSTRLYYKNEIISEIDVYYKINQPLSKVTYNNRGKPVKDINFSNGDFSYSYYDAGDLLKMKLHYAKDSILIDSTIYTCDSLGRIVKASGYYREDNIETSDINEYNRNGELLEQCSTYGNVTWCSTYEYDTLPGSGNIRIKETIWGSGGRSDSGSVSIKDRSGKLLEMDSEEGITKYRYQPDGRLSITETNPGDKLTYRYEISYNLNGTLKDIRVTTTRRPYGGYNYSVYSYEHSYY